MSTPAFGLSKTSFAREAALREFACDVRTGLLKPQKELHSKYLYDDLGSSLFEAITYLPEYGLTRADERLLRDKAAEIASLLPPRVSVIELGSGTGRKTRHVLDAIRLRTGCVRYFPIDVSADALARCRHDLADIAEVHPLEQSYLHGMAHATAWRSPGESLLLLFLGSTIGNFERSCALEFLRDLHLALQPGDRLLLGADLVKDRDAMLVAYDDPTGVTAAFNLNLLGRVNRELGANFDLRAFEHQARWNEPERRIEMHLMSRTHQSAFISSADLHIDFQPGETIWTESSHKFHLSELASMAEQSGYRIEAQWTDSDWPFVEALWTVY